MATSSNSPRAVPSGKPGGPKASETDPPPSLLLRIFLICAFVITVGAYVAGQRSEAAGQDDAGRRQNEKLHRLLQERSKYQTYTKTGFQEENQRHYDLAVSNFHNALIIQDTAEGHYNLGGALLQQSRRAEAMEQFKAALERDPKLRDAYTSWGQALMDEGKADEAARIYGQAVAQNPDYSLTHFKLALALQAQRKNPEALAEFSQAARLGLDDADFWLRFGTVLNQEGKFAEAETNLARAAAMRADLPSLQFQLALAQQKQGKFTEAIAHYESALAGTPDEPDSLNNLALIHATATNADARNPKLAVSLATRASAAAGDRNPRYLDTLARSYAADGDFTQAALWEKKAMDRAGELGDKALEGESSARYALFQRHQTE
jgi:tetratricopeptide (TPR) repeat protein